MQKTFIKNLEFENFKAFKNANIQFCEGLNVINGPNGSGKSCILDGINFIFGNIENDLHLFYSDSLNLKVKIIFDNDNSIEKTLEKDLSNNIKTAYYFNGESVSKDKISESLKGLNLTIIDNCGCDLSKIELTKYAKELKSKSKLEQVIVVSFQEEIISVADKLLDVINNDK